MTLADSTFMLPEAAQLTASQRQIQRQVLAFITAHRRDGKAAVFALEGDAGTGKSALLSAVFSAVQKQARSTGGALAGTTNRLLVNHNEMLKIYWEVASQAQWLRKADFQKPTPFINARRKADIVFIDEAQLLLSQPDPFNRFRQNNQLTEILKLAHVVVLVLDLHQVTKLKSLWTSAMIKHTLAGHVVERATMTGQLRMQSPAAAAWVDAFASGQLLPLPHPVNYQLRVFEDGVPLYDWIKQMDRQHGLARVLATADFPFRVYTKEPWYVQAGKLRLPWDRVNFTDRPWASQPQTLNEVGSIYTIQGFDLNYAGVILGPSVDYDAKTDRITIDPARFEDQTAFRRRPDGTDSAADRTAIIFDVINILLKRGRMGLGLYAVNQALRQRLLAL